jgi:hypothetical protein
MNGCGIRGYSLKIAVIIIGILDVVSLKAVKNKDFSSVLQTLSGNIFVDADQ